MFRPFLDAIDPPEPQITGKTLCVATFLPFHALASSFFLFFPFSDLLCCSSPLWLFPPHLCSSISPYWSLTPKLPSLRTTGPWFWFATLVLTVAAKPRKLVKIERVQQRCSENTWSAPGSWQFFPMCDSLTPLTTFHVRIWGGQNV